MKYFAVEYGSGIYSHNDQAATVVGFETRQAMTNWIAEAPSSRKKLMAKQYVKNEDGKNVHVGRAAIGLTEYKAAKPSGRLVPLMPEREGWNEQRRDHRSKRGC